jgi:hypothetical protein
MISKAAGLSILLLVSLYTHGARQQDSVLNRIITVHADQLPVATILRNISEEQQIFFSYDASLINTERRITLHLEKLPLSEILQRLFPYGEFRFIRKEDYIIISAYGEDQDQQTGALQADTLSVLTLTGKVTDYITGEPLMYVSIAVKDEPLGTITNQDGEYILKLPVHYLKDSLIFSFIGFAGSVRAIADLYPEGSVRMNATSIRIKEIRVKAVSVDELLEGVRNQIAANYPSAFRLLTGFYRETIRQDNDYISVSEAVVEILKSPYPTDFREDKVRLLKARKSPDMRPFHWVNFKLQGGPYTITKLDAVKTSETFLDKEYQHLYRYTISDVIWYKDRPAYVVSFRPVKNISLPLFRGEMYIDRERLALLYARFSLDNYGLDMAEVSLIKKKPRGFRVKPLSVDYQVDYKFHDNKWQLYAARAYVAFRVRSREDRVNSVFGSTSELLITDSKHTDLKRFPGKEVFTINDIFSEITPDYDVHFWGNYNIIKPDEDLQNAIRGLFTPENK